MGKVSKRLYFTLDSKEGFLKALIFAITSFVFIYYLYLGVTTTPELIKDSDSLDYHLPIAESIVEQGFIKAPELRYGLGYYPAVGEAILSLFIRANIPLNLFNLFALVLLFGLCYKLATTYGLRKFEALVFSFSIATTNSVLRLILNQTVDIWLAVFFVWALYLFNENKKDFFHFFLLGCSVGLLTGVKYSGILFSIILSILFWKKLPKFSNTRKLFAFLIPLIIFGLFWYIRNYNLTGNPIYPGRLLNFPSHPEFMLQDSSTLLTILRYPKGLWLFVQALISEYLFWAISFFTLPILVFIWYRKKELIDTNIKVLAILGCANIIIYLLLPSWPGNIISDLRYAFVTAIPNILVLFLIAQKVNILDKLIFISFLTSISVITQFNFRPKIIFAWIILMASIISLHKFRHNKR